MLQQHVVRDLYSYKSETKYAQRKSEKGMAQTARNSYIKCADHEITRR